MKDKSFLVFLFVLFFLNINSYYSQELWYKKKSLVESKEIYQKKNFPSQYQILSLNNKKLNEDLKRKSSNQNIIKLPNEDGSLSQFRIRETSNFNKILQAKFPNIRAYSAQGIDDPTAIAKISFGTDGFHAVISSGKKETIYIDPYSKNNRDYIIYKKSSLTKVDEDFRCLVETSAKQELSSLSFTKNADDGKLRTFRLAIVCSGEYAQFHLNRQNIASTETDAVKKAAVLSAINTSMSRINGVFEKDLSVKLELIANNDDIIFLDATSDNITDGNANIMIREVQDIIDTTIGSANYDIGHIFSIGGSGLAGLGVVCRNGQKARGVTGISSPVSDPYDIDYVAHELGHQFGANHTQNNSCNRNNATAVEPGSGSTIMGYAGICNPNVIGTGPSTGNSDDYFHAISIAEMWNTIQSSANCAVLSDTNNSAPTANAGENYTIPKSTPFKLIGNATDADGTNSLSYNWEQMDNEIGSMPPSSTNVQGPMFRSLPSKDVPIRYFPNLATVVGGSNSNTWEVLPSVARELNFAFTVRDNNIGGGNSARDDMKLTVVNSDTFVITSQQNDLTWNTGSTETITWNVGETNLSPINCSFVNIRLSTNGGLTFPILLKSNTPNDGSEDLVIPNEATENGRIMVEAADNVFYNINSGTIVVNSITPTFVLNNISNSQSACNIANESVNYILNIDFVNDFSENVTFSASGQPQGSQVTFNPSEINSDGNIEMTISNLEGLTPNNYTININGVSNSITKNVDVLFQLTLPTFDPLILLAPADNEIDVELTSELSWDIDNNATTYEVEVSKDINFNSIISSKTDINNNYFITNVLDPLTTYYWRVRSKNTCGIGNYSSTFSFRTEQCKVCNSSGNTDYDTSTTLVEFNTLQNASTKSNINNIKQGYFDYTDLSTTLQIDEEYNLKVNVNTDGGYQTQTKVWIDWNGDCIFNETTEEYDLGSSFNANDGATSESPMAIRVPNNAKPGNRIMRVSTKYTETNSVTYPLSCTENFDGEVEDYTIIVEEIIPTINDVSFDNFNLFPNPNSGSFTLMFDSIDTNETRLELFDVRGRIVGKILFTKTNLTFKEIIQFNNLGSGLYLLKIKNGAKQTTRKLFIN